MTGNRMLILPQLNAPGFVDSSLRSGGRVGCEEMEGGEGGREGELGLVCKMNF